MLVACLRAEVCPGGPSLSSYVSVFRLLAGKSASSLGVMQPGVADFCEQHALEGPASQDLEAVALAMRVVWKAKRAVVPHKLLGEPGRQGPKLGLTTTHSLPHTCCCC